MKCARCGKEVKETSDLLCVNCWEQIACDNLDRLYKEKEKTQKLSKLEDIEEELDVDFLKILNHLVCKDGVVWVKLPYIPRGVEEEYPEIVCLDIAVKTEWCFKPFNAHFVVEIGYVVMEYKLKDYGKTWALTKEELKNEQIENYIRKP